jgi:PhzF family phenazine biosynthesis protein
LKKEATDLKIPTYQVDAFTDEAFKGNPAAVCILPHRLREDVMLTIASEMNLSETAFLTPIEQKSLKESTDFILRWFTPKVEVPLCGHATLATSAVLFREIGVSSDTLNFETKSGMLTAKKVNGEILLDFPGDMPGPIDPPEALLKALGIPDYKNIALTETSKKLLVHVKNEKIVKNLKPNFESMLNTENEEEIWGVIATSPGSPPYDFISRFFAPWVGINEDPVTGAAHTVLTPYWSRILKKDEMTAFQASERGGKLKVKMNANKRVGLIGNAVVVLKGELII